MSGQLKKEYEISTSVSAEHILEELKEMKKKFITIGQVKPEHFSLMVLAPSHQVGRRRTGGFVQLTGKIEDNGELRTIQVKNVSGASFIIPMLLVMVILTGIALVFAAGDRSPELLFPLAFSLVFSSVLIYMRMTEGGRAEAVLREHFEGTDRATEFRYTTHYTKEQCMEFMTHDNGNDLYEYEWRQEKNFGALIMKDYKKPDHVRDFDGRQEWGFIVRFHQQPDDTGAVVEAKLVQTEKLPYIHNKSKIDLFWEHKLGAVAM